MLVAAWALSEALSEASAFAPETTIFMPPALEQTICVSVGLKMGDAMATPRNNANHTNTRRANDLCVAALNMWRIIAEADPLFSQAP